MSKVYVVKHAYQRNSGGTAHVVIEPIAIFSTKKKAENYISREEKAHGKEQHYGIDNLWFGKMFIDPVTLDSEHSGFMAQAMYPILKKYNEYKKEKQDEPEEDYYDIEHPSEAYWERLWYSSPTCRQGHLMYRCSNCMHETEFRNAKCPSCGYTMRGFTDEDNEN